MRAVAVMVIVLTCLGGLEGAARLADWVQQQPMPGLAPHLNATLALNPYQVPSPTFLRHWRLRPNWSADAGEVAAQKARDGRTEGARAIADLGESRYYQPLTINRSGFKGQEIDPTHRRPRLLVIGDSVTFGMAGWDWPQAMGSALEKRGIPAEVINAGVEGYAVRNALLELPSLLATQPQMCLIMLGWNDIFASTEAEQSGLGEYLRVIGIGRRLLSLAATLSESSIDRAHHLRDKPKRADRSDPEIARWNHPPPGLIDSLDRLGSTLQSGGCAVSLITLPGLYRLDRTPSAEALRIGHLPAFTDNPFVLAARTRATNQAFAALAAARGWTLIDLDPWADVALSPPERWFTDSVHPTGQGLEAIGTIIADRLDFGRGQGR